MDNNKPPSPLTVVQDDPDSRILSPELQRGVEMFKELDTQAKR